MHFCSFAISFEGMKRNRLKAYGALAVVCIVWGTTYLGIRLAVATFPPLFFSALRLLLTSGLIFILMHKRIRWSEFSAGMIKQQAMAGLFMFAVGSGMVSMAEVGISSGMASIIGAMSPVWVILFNRFMNPGSRITSGLVLGTCTGLTGIALIFGDFDLTQDHTTLWGATCMFIAGLAFAGGSVWIKNKKLVAEPFGAAGIQMLSGGLVLVPLSLATENWSVIHFDLQSILVIGYLVVFGSLVGYFCYLYAIRRLPVTLVSVYSYVNPVVAVLLGWLILAEPINNRMVMGMVITLTGVYLVNRGSMIRRFWKKASTS